MNKDAGEDEQRQRLLSFGVAPEHIYVDDATKSSYRSTDDLKARESIIKDIRPGSRVVVATLDRLGASAVDIMATLGDITAKGAGVHVIDPGKTYEGAGFGDWVQDALDADKNQKRKRMVKARGTLTDRKVKTGPPPKLDGTAKLAARQDYDDLTQPIRAVAKKHGVSPTTLRRLFGERGTPRGRRKKEVSS